MLRLTDVSFSYGCTPALSEISLTVEKGEFLGVVGPNSSGKSTLLKIISRIRRPQQGTVNLMGRPLNAWPLAELARAVTVVSSEDYFVFPFSVEQIVLMGRTPFVARGRRETAHDLEIVHYAMHETDVWHLRERAIHELSSGERQRALLARALSQETPLLLLDEPTTHLDIGHEWAFFDLLRRLHEERHLTVICAVHNLALAARYGNRTVMLRQGRVQAEGPPRDVFNEASIRHVFGVSAGVHWSGPSGRFLSLTPTAKGIPDENN